MKQLRTHAGLTLIELLIFLGLTSAVSVSVLFFMISAQEGNARAQALLELERSGAALLQSFTYHVRRSERILSPTLGGSGRVLALQTATAETDPTLIGQQGSGIVIIERDMAYDLIGGGDVTVVALVFSNTSPDALHPSAELSVTLARRPSTPTAETLVRTFIVSATAFPADIPQGNACGCNPPNCATPNSLQWQACLDGTCQPLTETFVCP